MPSRFFEAFAVCGLFILIAAGTFVHADNIASLFTLGAFVAAAYKITPSISRIINLAGLTKTYNYTLKELVNISKEKQILQPITGAAKISSIAFKDVSFAYNGKIILQCFNCNATSGLLTGIKGISGKGKTTLVNLLLGFLTPAEGGILFNNKLVNAEEIKAYRSRIAYVKQEPFILHDSILRNITLLESEYDNDKLCKAIDGSGLHEFVSSFPEGIEKIINESGKNISGGQRQRIAIARALYKDADLIILDEPFNELDEPSELQLMQYFKQLALSGKIVLLITHNSNSIHLCNNFISLDE
jgi:ABC-type bacteriocin/lantibiotic exporter with double-glycine peptidase domain